MATPSANVKTIASKQEFDALLKQYPYVALQAHAVWCGPCKAISPMFQKHADTFADSHPNLAFADFDIDDVSDLAHELGIKSIPAFFFFEDAAKIDAKRVQGANPPALKKACEDVAAMAKAKAEL